MSVVITVAPTGPVATTKDNPHLPVTPEQIAEQVHEAYELGASVAHLHFRDADERPTADLEVAKRTIALIEERCPILIQLSTGVGRGATFEERAALVELRPRMATLNPCAMTFGDMIFDNPPEGVRRLAGRMQELGVKPELEIYDTGHLDYCLRMRDAGLFDGPLQLSIVLGVQGGMAATPQNLNLMIDRTPEDSIWQVVAIGKANLQLTSIGLANGANARAGLEDTLHLRRGELSQGNAPLVKRAVDLAKAMDRTPLTVAETEALLQLPPR